MVWMTMNISYTLVTLKRNKDELGIRGIALIKIQKEC